MIPGKKAGLSYFPITLFSNKLKYLQDFAFIRLNHHVPKEMCAVESMTLKQIIVRVKKSGTRCCSLWHLGRLQRSWDVAQEMQNFIWTCRMAAEPSHLPQGSVMLQIWGLCPSEHTPNQLWA